MDELINGPEVTSLQGANRSKTLVETIDFEPNKFQAQEISKAKNREMGVIRNPNQLESVGVKAINTDNSVNTVFPPEIGKGSITDSIV
tara:strand:+ start:556 stop:819 length:264 start_codon:yes stop_codon:yes gene_type:complete